MEKSLVAGATGGGAPEAGIPQIFPAFRRQEAPDIPPEMALEVYLLYNLNLGYPIVVNWKIVTARRGSLQKEMT